MPQGLSIERQPLRQMNRLGNSAGASQVQGPSFSDYLTEQINRVNSTVVNADQKVADVTTGRSRNLHEMMVALNKADLSLKMLQQVRNKAVDAYQELMRMSL
jgi:flagellar hook-basal body complex protein FliE